MNAFINTEKAKILPREILQLLGETFESLPNSSLIYRRYLDWYRGIDTLDFYYIDVQSVDKQNRVKLYFSIREGEVADHIQLIYYELDGISELPIPQDVITNIQETSPIKMYINLTNLRVTILHLMNLYRKQFSSPDNMSEMAYMKKILKYLNYAINIVETDYLLSEEFY